ncbi:MAG: tetraacyldisaccharide 4'-kinase [Rickettsiales bacterium]|jgi:tetraacyldisaccharide 4'-kinase|nr:tetraacyldisaccharide 4'-kinase [Rickettsiales bacterium]
MITPFWFRNFNLFAVLLLPLSAAYFLLSKVFFIPRLFCGKISKTPVISIEKSYLGAAETTPFVREIAKYLGAPVIVPGRGRGSKARASDSAREAGVPAKILSASGIDVYIGNAPENISAIDYAESKVPAIVLDGAWNGAKNGISILFFDESAGNSFLLPAGPMRETPRSGVRRCDAVLLEHNNAAAANLRILKVAKKAKKPVFFARCELDATGLFGKYVAFASGDANVFFDALRNVISIRVVERVPFRGNHFYTRDEIVKLFRLAKKYDARLVCSENDWNKLPRNIQQKVRFVPKKVTLQPNFYVWLEKKLGVENEEG